MNCRKRPKSVLSSFNHKGFPSRAFATFAVRISQCCRSVAGICDYTISELALKKILKSLAFVVFLCASTTTLAEDAYRPGVKVDRIFQTSVDSAGHRIEYPQWGTQAFAEVVNLNHNGTNTGSVPAKIILFAIGTQGTPVALKR